MKLWLRVALGVLGLAVLVVAVQGYQDAKQRQRLREARDKLTPVPDLVIKAARAVKAAPKAQRANMGCGLVAAAAYRIAEARELGLSWEEATALTVTEAELMAPLRAGGADPTMLTAALAQRLYAMPAPPESHFVNDFLQCNASR